MRKLILLSLLSLLSCTIHAQVLPEELTHWDLVFPKDEMSGKTIMMAMLAPSEFTTFFGRERSLLGVVFKVKDEVLTFTMFDKVGFGPSDGTQYVTIKFDNELPESFDYTYGIKGSTRLIIIDRPEYIIKKVRKAHIMYLQLNIYGEGSHTMKYNVEHCPF